MDSLALETPQCLQEGWKTRMLNPYVLPKKTQPKWQVPNDEKNLQIDRIKTDSSHTVKGQKEKGKRSIWSETTILIVSCWPFIGLWSKMPEDEPVFLHEVTPEWQTDPVCDTLLILRPPQQETAEDEALSASAQVVTGPLGLLRVSGPRPHGLPSSLCTPGWRWVSGRSLRITCEGECWILKWVTRPHDKSYHPGIFGTSFPHA